MSWGLKEIIEPKELRKTNPAGMLYQIQRKESENQSLLFRTQNLVNFVFENSDPPVSRPTHSRSRSDLRVDQRCMKHSVEGVFKVNVDLINSLALSPSFLLDAVHLLLMLTQRPCLPPPCPGSKMLAGSTIFFNRSFMT